MKSLQELMLTTTSESELIEEQIYEQIIQAAKEERLRDVCRVLRLNEGSSLKFEVATANAMSVTKVAEGAEIPIDVSAYSEREFTPDKYGVRPLITSEMIEDAKFDVIEEQIREAGYQMGRNENSMIISALSDASSQTANHAFNSVGTELDVDDIVTAMRRIEEQNMTPDTIIMHPKQAAEIRLIDTFVEADKSGVNNPINKYFVGKIFNMNIYVNVSCTSDKVYVFDSRYALALVERRPVTMENYKDNIRDMTGIAVTQRLAIDYLRAEAVCEITVI